MTEKVIVSLIALSGVVISILVSSTIAFIQTKKSEENLKLELDKKFNEHLYKKRLDLYPDLYFALSELGKCLRKPEMTYLDAFKALDRIDEWDSKNAIFVSPVLIKLLLQVRNTIARSRKKQSDLVVTDKDRENYFKVALRLEQALKNEIGVYSLDGYHQEDFGELSLHSWKFPYKDPK
jgi:hypothetical protein